jgi:hypothetical protein
MKHQHKKIIFLVFLIGVLLLLGAACERIAPIQIENKTSEILTIYIDDYLIGDVKPGNKIKNDLVFAGQDWYLIEVYNTQGDVIYSHEYQNEEMKKVNWTIVIPPPES